MNKGDAGKSAQLGENFSAAHNRLRKMILFDLVKRLGLDVCYRCGKKIQTARELSIEHIVDWQGSSNPIGLFYDLTNIAFSHLTCNSAHICLKKTHCPHGHEYTSDNTYLDSAGYRRCRKCTKQSHINNRANDREYHRRIRKEK